MTTPPTNDATTRLSAVQAHIARAALDARRSAAAVTLIAVSKTHDAAAIQPLIDAGQRVFGENRVAEAAAKWPALRAANPDITLHMVGQLQSNKAEQAVALFDCVHSLDRPSLVTALAHAMDRAGRRIPCFIQVNLDPLGLPRGRAENPLALAQGEGQSRRGEGKGGCAPAALPALLELARKAGIDVIGLMTVPPLGLEPAPWFALLAKMADDHDLPCLSMGMSGDYESAVRIGATHVRVGSALFGTR
ncbi:MAG: YggS family pyridoxal phosphate enzyme [Sphingopyxis sp.]